MCDISECSTVDVSVDRSIAEELGDVEGIETTFLRLTATEFQRLEARF